MSTTHAYFLIDVSALDNCAAVTRVVTRILVYLASVHDAFTWNFEVVDLQTRQRALTAHGKRRICERKQLTRDTLRAFGDVLRGHRRDAAERRGARRAALDTLRERLMSLEADVEWGDPALMRSPSRAATMRAWTDPTRLNESMSVRSFLYVVGERPETPADVDRFLGTTQGETALLLEKLTWVRDGIVGNGIWESYARKRVGVSWIRTTRAAPLAATSPVDLLIDAVFGCCFEALGGCTMSVPDLDTRASLVPFSSVYAPVHRVRTHPSWSRKFAREISAVVDCFAALVQVPRAWTLPTEYTQEPDEADVALVEADCNRRQWLTDGRLLRRYDLPEMVALASKIQVAHAQRAVHAANCAAPLKYLLEAPVCAWPLAARHLIDVPILCRSEGRLRDGMFVLAQILSSTEHLQYVAVVPVDSTGTMAVYAMDATVFAKVQHVVDMARSECAATAGVSGNAAEPFKATWLESWASGIDYQLDVTPADHCAVDVSIDESLIGDYALAVAGSHTDPRNLSLDDEATDTVAESTGSDPLLQGLTADPASSLTGHTPSTLDAWYSGLYIKTIQQAVPDFADTIAAVKPILDGSADSSCAETAIAQLGAILQSSTSIEDVFADASSASAADPSTAQGESNDCLAALRLRSAAVIACNANARRTWQLHECQLQILLHLLAIDRARLWGQESDKLTEALNDLVDQLCIWTSVDDIFCSAPGGGDPDDGSGSGDLASAFVGSAVVGQFAERLGDIVDELRVQCGWVPVIADPDDDSAAAQGDLLLLENKRRKGTPRKITASQSERSEVIVQPSKQKTQLMSGRKLARHLEELIGGKRRFGVNSSSNVQKSASSADSEPSEPPAQRRRSTQLKLPLQLIRQLKNEVVSTTRPAPLSRSRTISSRSNSSGSGSMRRSGRNDISSSIRRGGRSDSSGSMRHSGWNNPSNSRTFSAAKTSTVNNCGRVAQRQPIPEFVDLSSSPSISGRVKELHLVPETPSKKRLRTGDPVPASSPSMFIPSSLPAANAFIYESDESEGLAERSPLFARLMAHGQQLYQEPAATADHLQGQSSRRVLRFSDNRGR
ncbi:hypothetical protein IWW50_000571 [Coemansia erecta]|nr:hypothetical protein IWW50_000571 [Coemansia erecta]